MDSKKIRIFLWGHLSPHKNWLLLSAFFALLLAGVKVWLAYTLKPLMDLGFIAGDFSQTIRISIFVLALIFADGVFSYFHRISLRTGVEKFLIDIKVRLFKRILILSQKDLAQLESGRAVTLLFNDTSVIKQGLHIASDLVRQPLALIGLLGYLFYSNWLLTTMCIIALPLVAFVAKKLGESSKRNQRRIQVALDQVSQHSLESIQGLRTAHAFGRIAELKNSFISKIMQAYRPTIKQASVQEVIAPISKLLFGLTGAALIIACGYFVSVSQTMSPGEVLAFMMAAGLLQDPLRQLNNVHVRLQEVYASSERILTVLEDEIDSVAKAQMSLLTRDIANKGCAKDPLPLRFDQVSFSYTPNENKNDSKALKSVSFTLEPGKKLALVGPSGSGKSTLSLMAMRYLDPENGHVLLGAKNARDWSIEEFRSNFSYVSQDVFLFSKTLRENLLFASPQASDTDIWQALDQARLKTFVEALPHKLDTMIQERALNLSGGEKQRIAIARAILRNAPIVILDEATSQLDIENEQLIQQAMDSLVVGKSVIIIAHRLSTVKEVDEILVLDQGKIIERGSPKELVDNPDTWFARMWSSQSYS
jgi:ATP-binding cassette, subfamily B, bacterial MsbA